MKRWLITFGLLALWSYTAIANYHRGDFMKIVVAALALILLGHIIFGVCKGMLWLLQTLIVADLREKLRRDDEQSSRP